MRLKDNSDISDACVRDKAAVFDKLMKLSDKEVMKLAAVLMAEALVSGDDAVHVAGKALSVDLAGRRMNRSGRTLDKQVINAVLCVNHTKTPRCEFLATPQPGVAMIWGWGERQRLRPGSGAIGGAC